MLVLLPPSETKRDGGDGPPLRLGALSHPALDPVRERLVDELVELAADPAACRAALGLTPAQHAEVTRNAALRTSPTAPALHRYSGVLYDALDVGTLRGAAAARARSRLAVGSALFGLVRADDPIPAYRLSAGAKLPGGGTLAGRWRPLLQPVLAAIAAEELVVDLRSGSYAALARVPGAVAVDAVAELPDGSRKVISHSNKAHKGRLARLLAGTRAEPTDAAAVAALARRAGMRVERPTPSTLHLIIPSP
ncbi:peroxide stress protein YaaA [Pseudonocardia humida]|uniref:Peroxide stress protein YaaA n=1 Tax=Pseudonocardia humida TaxID=2800819 RepID=A0ABT0ZUL3_9PSEU|nr:peroxide stress protein YaaA [Pseudonocardia humida]MCO1654422.1 peroxide stress protein YaaA [Pseudonocardia humida]